MLSAVIHIAFTYIIAIIVVAYFLVQANEAITFILNPYVGLLWKLLWIIYLSVAAYVFTFLILSLRDIGVEPVFRGNPQLRQL